MTTQFSSPTLSTSLFAHKTLLRSGYRTPSEKHQNSYNILIRLSSSGVVAVFLHLIYNTAMDNLSESLLLPLTLSLAISEETIHPIDLQIRPQRQLSEFKSDHVSKREEYGYQWWDIHNPARFPFTPRRERCQEM